MALLKEMVEFWLVGIAFLFATHSIYNDNHLARNQRLRVRNQMTP